MNKQKIHMQKTNLVFRNRQKRNCMVIVRVMFLSLFLLFLAGCGKTEQAMQMQDQKAEQLNLEQLKSVCELATMECYYHNTARSSTDKKVLFWNTSKKLWMEYSGIVRIGIDISRLDLDISGQTVTITLPEAKIISCRVDEDSLSKDHVYTELTGLGASRVTAQDQTEAFANAQQNMLEEVEKDTSLLLQAQDRAKTLLLNYVKNIGDAIGMEYHVQWKM